MWQTFPHPKNEAVWLTTTLVISSKRNLHFSPLPLVPHGLTDCSLSRPVLCRDGVQTGHTRSSAASPIPTLCVSGQSS